MRSEPALAHVVVIVVIPHHAPRGLHGVFEDPYPDGYPTSAPKKNRVIDILEDESVELIGRRVEKDFMAYKVR